MIVVFVHGWSVTNTNTYGGLPEALAQQAAAHGLELEIAHVWLGRYISFHDEVKLADLVVAFQRALADALAPGGGAVPAFACVTHSTGGPLVREWLEHFHGAARLGEAPLRHLVMLAPANHGSPLAVLGKERVGRMKAWFNGIEPGVGILRWLSLGSADQWRLNEAWLDYDGPAAGFYPFVLTGQGIDGKLYDFLNSYLVEVGSDGVVRAAGANVNCSVLTLTETDAVVRNGSFTPREARVLSPDGGPRRPRRPVGFGVLPRTSHSGKAMGIMGSVTAATAAQKPVVAEILRCLAVHSAAAYDQRCRELEDLTAATQADDAHSRNHRYVNLVFAIVDDQGVAVNDFDLYLMAGNRFDPAGLPKGFFIDRQRNPDTPNCLIYYLDYDVLKTAPQERLGIRVAGRPAQGFAGYRPVEFRTDGETLLSTLQPNQTCYIRVVLRRHVDVNAFRLGPATESSRDFKGTRPAELT